jgi:PAS domain S-box-containing protein
MGTKHEAFFSFLGVKKLRDKLFLVLATFLSISLAALIISVQTGVSIKELAPAIDAAGRQSVLAQKMLAEAVMAHHEYGHAGGDAGKSSEDFEGTLSLLEKGGLTDGVRIQGAPRQVRPYLKKLGAAWLGFKPDYQWLTEKQSGRSDAEIDRRLDRLDAESGPLLAAAHEVENRLRWHAAGLINSALWTILLLTAAVLAAFFLASRVMQRGLLQPVEELTLAAGRIAEGDCSFSLTHDDDDELGELQRSFARMCGTLKKDRTVRKVSTELLTLAMENDGLDSFIEKALNAILSVPWFMIQPKGAIFLSDNSSKKLVLKAQKGLHESLLKTCAAVPFGRCLCGRAAASGEIVFAQDVDGRHENSYDGIKPHGHYCLPLRSDGDLVGVLTLYLEAGHTEDPDETAQLKNVGGLLAEIIEKKRAHTEQQKMSGIIQQASEAVFVTGTDGRITYVNKAFEKMTGFTAEEASGKTPNLLKNGEHPPEYYGKMWTSMQKGVPWTGKIVNKRKDGAFYTVRANIFPLKNPAGETTAYVTIQEDISALTEVEEQLRQSQKMEAVGRLAGGVAHDFNNILMAIDSYTQFLRPALDGNVQGSEDLDEIKKAVGRAAAITRQLLAFSRKQKADFQPLDLRQAVQENEKMLKRLLGAGVSLEISAAAEVKPVKADPGQIDQILMNLAVNAKDAMPGGGRIEIKALPHKLSIPVPTPLGTMPAGEYSAITVRDTGTGIDKETLSKIFDPFFTTKPKGKGTGLGLSIVYGIIKHHGAYITVASQPGKGSTFTLYFPVLTGAGPEPARAAAPAAAVLPRGLTVFLAEDDPTIRASVTRMLLALGAKVEPFPDPEKALESAAGYVGEIHLLITDIVMPGMDGFALAERLTQKSPKTAVLYMSGHTDPDIFRGRLEEPGIIFLQKPFSQELLAGAVARALKKREAA